eukprot:gene3252-2234_t
MSSARTHSLTHQSPALVRLLHHMHKHLPNNIKHRSKNSHPNAQSTIFPQTFTIQYTQTIPNKKHNSHRPTIKYNTNRSCHNTSAAYTKTSKTPSTTTQETQQNHNHHTTPKLKNI